MALWSGEYPHLQESPLQDVGRSPNLPGWAPNAVYERQREGSRPVQGPCGLGVWEKAPLAGVAVGPGLTFSEHK